jgi:hypothetical protein
VDSIPIFYSIWFYGRVVNAAGAVSFEAEVKGKDLIFDEKGNFLKVN